MLRVLLAYLALLWLPQAASAQDLQTFLQSHREEIANPSRQSVGAVIDDLIALNPPGTPSFLQAWQTKEIWMRAPDGLFFLATETADDLYTLREIATGAEAASDVPAATLTQIKPNGGVRGLIGEALVRFHLSDHEIDRRREAVESIARRPDPSQLAPLAAAIENEPDPALKARKEEVLGFLEARFATDTETRQRAIAAMADSLSIEARAVLNQILTKEFAVAPSLPEDANIAAILVPGDGLDRETAYRALVDAGLAQEHITPEMLRALLEANIAEGMVGGVPIGQLDRQAARDRAYKALVAMGKAPRRATSDDIEAELKAHVFFEAYKEPDNSITEAARKALDRIETRVAFSQAADLALDGISLASIYFLAAIGLAITFGVMGVINMAHGEFIMMGAYTGYVVQLFIPDYTLSLVVALPLAFAVTFGAGVAMERLVIRWLYHRPLETLLATFGISIALQQLAKNIFGTQARPLTSPGWLDGALVMNDVIQISYIRIAIFILALMFLAFLLVILKRTRLGLEVRAVTQNPRMAASMGINTDRINMLTFGLGSGIAGIAGVAIGLYAKVTSEMGADYIVQSFMTVVVGGVGNVWGTLAGATLIGFLQKGIEWVYPSNTLAAQTYMILFIILFIQFRPKGIVALKGRAAGD